jgi:curved DNA-binding protein CbpA
MHASAAQAEASRVPRLAPGCDPTRLPLSPAEGYLLSRVDGATSWAVLRQIGGLPPEEVDRCLERWLEAGLLEIGAPCASRGQAPGTGGQGPLTSASAPSSKGVDPETLLDPSLPLELDAQRRILAFESRLDRPYHEILGVPRSADAKVVKRAYFELSKEFHPDRYFRRDIGAFTERLERVFKRIAEAYELLSDPTTRVEVERTLDESETVAQAPIDPSGVRDATDAARRARKALDPKHLRMLGQRKGRAKTFFETGMGAFQGGRWLEAAASVRLAIAYDPGNQSYREAFGAVQRKASEERGRQLTREAERALDLRDHKEALRLYEEALHHRPHDPEGNYEAARLVWLLGEDLRRAKEYAARACELVPENAIYRRTLGQIYKAAGLTANAKRELEAALKINPKDVTARAELKSLP